MCWCFIHYSYVICLFFWRYNPLWLYFHSPLAGFSLLVFEASWSHTTTRHSREDSSGWVINPSQRPLPNNTQHSQQTNIHDPGGIRTHNLSRRAAEDLRLRPRGLWDRHVKSYIIIKSVNCVFVLRTHKITHVWNVERDHLENPVVDGRIILRWMFRKWDVGVWTGFIWLRIGTGGEYLWMR